MVILRPCSSCSQARNRELGVDRRGCPEVDRQPGGVRPPADHAVHGAHQLVDQHRHDAAVHPAGRPLEHRVDVDGCDDSAVSIASHVHPHRPRVEAAAAGRERIELDGSPTATAGVGPPWPPPGRRASPCPHPCHEGTGVQPVGEGVGDAGDAAELVIGDVTTGDGAVQPPERARRLLERRPVPHPRPDPSDRRDPPRTVPSGARACPGGNPGARERFGHLVDVSPIWARSVSGADPSRIPGRIGPSDVVARFSAQNPAGRHRGSRRGCRPSPRFQSSSTTAFVERPGHENLPAVLSPHDERRSPALVAGALAVLAPRPAARSAPDLPPAPPAFGGCGAPVSRLLFGIVDPADELVAGERGDVDPRPRGPLRW